MYFAGSDFVKRQRNYIFQRTTYKQLLDSQEQVFWIARVDIPEYSDFAAIASTKEECVANFQAHVDHVLKPRIIQRVMRSAWYEPELVRGLVKDERGELTAINGYVGYVHVGRNTVLSAEGKTRHETEEKVADLVAGWFVDAE